MRKELLLVSGLLIGSMAFAIDPAEIDSLINLKGVVVSANKIHVNRNSVPLSISVIEREEIEASSESALLPVLSERVPGCLSRKKGLQVSAFPRERPGRLIFGVSDRVIRS